MDGNIFNLLNGDEDFFHRQDSRNFLLESEDSGIIDQGHPFTPAVKFSDMEVGTTYIFSGDYVSGENTFYIDTYAGLFTDATGTSYEFKRGNYVDIKYKDNVGFPFILGAEFLIKRKKPRTCKTGYFKDEIRFIYQLLLKDNNDIIKLVKDGHFTSKLSTYLNMPFVNSFIDLPVGELHALYNIFTQTKDLLKKNKIFPRRDVCVYRSARITIGGPYGIDFNNFYMPIPFSCTTSFKFALNWGSDDNYILSIKGVDTWFPADDPYAEKTQNEFVLPAGKIDVVDRYYNDIIKRFILLCTFIPMTLEECVEYVQSHSLHEKETYSSNIGISFDTKDPFITYVTENS